MKLGVIGYIPPPNYPGAAAFLENMKKFPTRNELVLYSNHPYPEAVAKIKDPEFVHGAARSGNPNPNPQIQRWTVNNAIFMTGLRVARSAGFSHIIYLESDCRVGQVAWDQVVFNEFFTSDFPYICGGTLVCWNPFNGGLEVARRWEQLLISKNRKRNFPIPTYGVRKEGTNMKEEGDPSIFPNGALGVYSLAWLETLFDLNNTVEFANRFAWDFQIGIAIWKKFGLKSFDMVLHLDSILSAYGNEVTTLEERLNLLKSGKIAAVHQIKGDITV